jgi:ADP-ribose pyrophosphatase
MTGGRSVFRSKYDEVVHSWAVFRLLRRFVESDSGQEFERTFVSTPGAVACVALTHEGLVVLVRQYRATFDTVVTELPAGMRDIEGESPEVTALRELKEETGYVASSMERMGTCLSSPGVTDSSVEVYFASNLVKGNAEPHGPEEDSMEVLLVPFQEALTMVEDGRITDGKTAYGLMLAARKYPHLLS